MAKKQVCPEGVPGWIVSYGDMMSLLLTFFIMLFAISAIDADKAQVVSVVMQDTFGYTKNAYVPIPGGKWPTTQSGGTKDGRKMTTQTIQDGNPTMRNRIPIKTPPEKVVTGIVYFEPDSASLTSTARKALQEVYDRVKGRPHRLELRGHAGINEQGTSRDQMDLSYARSYSVREYLTELGVKPDRIVITSLGQYEPNAEIVAVGSGEVNAFVEIILLADQISTEKTP